MKLMAVDSGGASPVDTVAGGRALIFMGQADARRRRVGLQVNRLPASVIQQHPDQVRAHVNQAATGRVDEVFPGAGGFALR